MLKRWMKPLMLGIAVMVASAGCSRGEHVPSASANSSVLRIASHEDPASFDPRIAGDGCSQAVIHALFEGLTRQNEQGELRLALAKDVSVSQDGLVYTFHLKDTLWSNQMEVTAYDFEHAWKSIISKESTSWFGYAFYIIKNARLAKTGEKELAEVGIESKDAKTLVVTLEHPAPYFLELTSNPVYSPVCKTIDEQDPSWTTKVGSDYVCNGPFTLKEHRMREQITLEKNANYWDAGSVSLTGLSVAIVPDDLTALHLFERNELDWIGSPITSLPKEVMPQLAKEGRLSLQDCSAVVWLEYCVENAPFNHPKMRKAFGLALNRCDLVQHVLKGGEDPAFSILPKQMTQLNPPSFQDASVEEARTLFHEALQELGMKKDELPPLVLSYSHKHSAFVQAIQQQWREAFDLDVQLELSEWNVYIDKLVAHNYQMAILGWFSWFNDPIYNLENQKYANDSMNDTGWEDPKYAQLLDLSDNTLDQSERLLILKEAESYLIDQMPLCPIYYLKENSLQQENISGIFRTPLGSVDFAFAKKG